MAAVSAPAIGLESLHFRWSARSELCLDLPRFEVAAGERVFIHGPSGSGKSTLLGLLGGVIVPEQGSVRVLGTDLAAMSGPARDRFRAHHVGYIFQQFNLVPYLSVIANVLLPCRFSSLRKARALSKGGTPRAEAARLLGELDIAAELHSRPALQLSVGQQQRVAVARALIGQPEIIIADEPTSSLDAARQQAFLDLLLRECEEAGATLLFVSHDHRLAAAFTRKVDLPGINRAQPEPGP